MESSSSAGFAWRDAPFFGCAHSPSLLGPSALRGLGSFLRQPFVGGIPPRGVRRRGGRRGVRGPALLALVVALGTVGDLRAQGGPSIAEMERLLAERESTILQLDASLGRLEAIGDSLARAKRRAQPGSAQYERISNQIRENSLQIEPIQRSLRQQHDEARDLRQRLFLRYNTAVAETNTRIQELRRQGRTPQQSPELRRLVDLLPEYIEGRERYAAAVEEERCAPFQPELVLLASDGPSQLRYKEALARDMVDQSDACIGEIQGRIDNIVQRRRIKEEAERLRRELEMWGDDQSQSTASEIEAMLEGRTGGTRGIDNPFEDPQAQIRALQRRRLELLERREEYETKARAFAQRLREFYP
jgi:hypothetical protein